jgi:hypothetical protein
MMSGTTIDLLYFAGCPGYERLLPIARTLAEEAGAELTLRAVETDDAAQAERFLGSPTVRVDGRDVEPGADARTDFGLKCRLYAVAPEDRLRAALGR